MNETRLFESLFDVLPFSVYVVEVESFRIVYMNEKMKERVAKREEAPCWKMIYGLEEKCPFCRVDALRDERGRPNQKMEVFEYFNELDDRWYQLQEKVVGWPSGETVKYSIAVDITELKGAQSSLTEAHALLALRSKELEAANRQLSDQVEEENAQRLASQRRAMLFEEKLEEIQHLSATGMWRWNLEEGVFYWSNELFRIYGYEEAETVPTLEFFLETLPDGDRQAFERGLDSLVGERRIFQLEHRFRRKNGEEGLFFTKGQGELDEEGKLREIFGFSQDVTESRELEQRQKIQEILLMQQAKMAAMGEMIGVIAHQWQQPLNVISMIAMLLKDTSAEGSLEPDMLDRKLDGISEQVVFMAQTIKDFRDFFKPTKEQHPFDAREAIGKILEILFPQLSRMNVKVALEEETPLTFYGMANEFQHVVMNVVGNAADACHSSRVRGEVVVRLLTEGAEGVVTIRDNGGGISPDNMEKLFEPYFTTKGEAGTGMGLYIGKTIVEDQMGGRFSARNEGDGAVFEIRLPLYR